MKTPHADPKVVEDLNANAGTNPDGGLIGLEPALEFTRKHDGAYYRLVYGPRRDDRVMVLHFFPLQGGKWNHELIRRRLTDALARFPAEDVHAEYVPEVESYFVKVAKIGSYPNPWLETDRIIAALDAP